MLERCRRLEERAAAVYRSYAAAARTDPALCALWTALAREEEEHTESLSQARTQMEPTAGGRTWLEGWDEALGAVDVCLTAAERLGADALSARQLSAALELEMTELEAIRHVLLAACPTPYAAGPDQHAVRLADAAQRLSDDPQVRLQVALFRARTWLKKAG